MTALSYFTPGMVQSNWIAFSKSGSKEIENSSETEQIANPFRTFGVILVALHSFHPFRVSNDNVFLSLISVIGNMRSGSRYHHFIGMCQGKESCFYKAAINRSYYAIFHGISAINILDGVDASKHSSVIAYFNQFLFIQENLTK